jgi:hypothetical protein
MPRVGPKIKPGTGKNTPDGKRFSEIMKKRLAKPERGVILE